MNNDKTTLLNDVTLTLNSFVSGQGKTCDLETGMKVSDKIQLEGLKLWYQGNILTFKSEAHKTAYILSILYRIYKDMSEDQVIKLFDHLGKGYLSLNHRESETVKDYTSLFNSINYNSVERVSAKSKLYNLLFDVKPEHITLLVAGGFKIVTPIMDSNYSVIGFSVEYPPKD